MCRLRELSPIVAFVQREFFLHPEHLHRKHSRPDDLDPPDFYIRHCCGLASCANLHFFVYPDAFELWTIVAVGMEGTLPEWSVVEN